MIPTSVYVWMVSIKIRLIIHVFYVMLLVALNAHKMLNVTHVHNKKDLFLNLIIIHVHVYLQDI
jgi:hypothetical protein